MTLKEFNARAFSRWHRLRAEGRVLEAAQLRYRLIRRNVGIARSLGWKFERVFEVPGSRLLAFSLLSIAVDAFEPTNGKSFAKCAARFLQRRLLSLWLLQRAREMRSDRRRRTRYAPSVGADTEAPADLVACLLDRLAPHDRELIEQRYGLDGDDPMTFAEIGRMRRRSWQAIQQQELRILRRLRLEAQLMEGRR